MASHIPPVIVESIFLRLPVKSLLRFRCVSKAAVELISDPHFVKTHLHLQHTQARTRLCVVDIYDKSRSVRAFIGDCEALGDDNDYGSDSESYGDDDSNVNGASTESDSETDNETTDDDEDDRSVSFKTHYLLENIKSNVDVLESCNGLMCLTDYHRDIALWNPSTRQCNQLSKKPVLLGRDYVHHFGFGYDSIKDDYKIIRLSSSSSDYHYKTVVDVFSLKSDDWRRIEESPKSRVSCMWGTFLHGAVHWVARLDNSNQEIIMAFDIAKEEFRKMEIRLFPFRNGKLRVIRGCLCAYSDADLMQEIWVMKEYGDESSWSRISPYMADKKCELLYNVNDKHLLLVNQKNLVLYDERQNRYKKIMPYWDEFFEFDANLFVESLVSPFP